MPRSSDGWRLPGRRRSELRTGGPPCGCSQQRGTWAAGYRAGNCLRVAVLALAANLSIVSGGIAQERYDDASLEELQQFDLDIGAYLIARYDTRIRFDSNTVPFGTVIDLEEMLDVESSSTTGRIDGFYRFNKRHRLDWTYYSSRRRGEAVLEQEVVIGDPDDPDGECTIGAGATTQSQIDFQLLKVGYSYSFLNTRKYELFLGGGFNIRDLEIRINAEGNLSGCELDDGDSTNISSDPIIPLPTINFGGRWNFTPKWQARWQWQQFALQFGDYKGRSTDTTLLLEHRTFKNVGFGTGINAFDMRVEGDGSDFTGELTFSYLGLLGYVKLYF